MGDGHGPKLVPQRCWMGHDRPVPAVSNVWLALRQGGSRFSTPSTNNKSADGGKCSMVLESAKRTDRAWQPPAVKTRG